MCLSQPDDDVWVSSFGSFPVCALLYTSLLPVKRGKELSEWLTPNFLCIFIQNKSTSHPELALSAFKFTLSQTTTGTVAHKVISCLYSVRIPANIALDFMIGFIVKNKQILATCFRYLYRSLPPRAHAMTSEECKKATPSAIHTGKRLSCLLGTKTNWVANEKCHVTININPKYAR